MTNRAQPPRRFTAGRLLPMAAAMVCGVVALTALSFLIAGNAGENSGLPSSDQPSSDPSGDDVAGVSATSPVPEAPSDIDPSLTIATDLIDPAAPETISGQITTLSNEPVDGVAVELYLTDADDEPTAFVTTVRTDPTGSYGIAAPVGCYDIRLKAPAGQTVVGGNPDLNVPICVNATIVRLTVDAQISE